MRGRTHRYRSLAAGALLIVGTIFLMAFFTYTKNVSESGHLWWKKTTTSEVPFTDRFPLLLIGVAFVAAAALFTVSAIRKFKLQDSNAAALAGAKADRQKRANARALARRDPQ